MLFVFCVIAMRLSRHILTSIMLLTAFCVYAQEQENEFNDLSDLSFNDQLIIYADKGDTSAALKLINRGADVNATTYEGVTPLMYATQNDDTAMLILLLQHGAKVDKKPLNGYTSLISAILNGSIQTAEFLIRNGADVNLPDNDNTTPLMHAISVDSFYLADMLLYYDAKVDLKNKQGTDALMVASMVNRFEIAVKLLEAGADINSVDGEGNTPLHYAALGGNTDLMELLIVNNASLEAVNSSGYTPLSATVAMNDYVASRLLISYGADVNSRINRSLTPLTLAIKNKNDSLIQMLRNQNARVINRPSFDQFAFGARFAFNGDDSQLGMSFGISDSKYKLMPSIGFGLRPKAVQVLDEPDPVTAIQYWERRQFVSLTLDKAFFMLPGKSAFSSGAFVGLSGVFTFGSYRGSENNPDSRLVINPRVGWTGTYEFIRLKLSYEFMDLQLNDFGTGWFNISLDFLFNRKGSNLRIPSMNWF